MSTQEPAAEGVEAVLGELDELAAGQRCVCIGDVLDDFGSRSFGPFIMLPALAELTPIGALLGVPSFLALIIAITAAQLLIGKKHVWMPPFIRRRSVSGRRLHRVVGRLRGVAQWLDERTQGRLIALTGGIWVKIAAVIIIALCGAVPLLEIFPLAASAPMLAIAAFGLALTVRDGVLMLAALVVGGLAVGVAGYLVATFLAG